jgi:hypothetical protein
VADDKQADMALTCEAQSQMMDEELLEIARRNAQEVGMDLSDGELKIGEWTEQ